MDEWFHGRPIPVLVVSLPATIRMVHNMIQVLQGSRLRSLLYHACMLWLEGLGPAPLVYGKCPRCSGKWKQQLADSVRGAAVEKRLELSGGPLVADVALLDGSGSVVVVVEIRDHHAVGDSKVNVLGNRPWLELAAEDVLAHPGAWRPLRSRNLGAPVCLCGLPWVKERATHLVWGTSHVTGCALVGANRNPWATVRYRDCCRCDYRYGEGWGREHSGYVIYCGHPILRSDGADKLNNAPQPTIGPMEKDTDSSSAQSSFLDAL